MRAFQWIQWLSMWWVLVENKGDKRRKSKSAGINHLSVCKISRASGVWLPSYILYIVFRIFNINSVWCIDYVIWTMNWMVHFIFLLFLQLEFFSFFLHLTNFVSTFCGVIFGIIISARRYDSLSLFQYKQRQTVNWKFSLSYIQYRLFYVA